MPRPPGHIPLPTEFTGPLRARAADCGPDGATWLAALPRLTAEVLQEWALEADGAPWHGNCAVVYPVRRQGEPLALKLTWPHREAAQEGRTLGLWSGRDAVRLVASDPHRWALLLERLEPRDLSGSGFLDQAETLGALAASLDRPAPPWVPRWSTELEDLLSWIERTLQSDTRPGFPPRLLREARRIALLIRAFDTRETPRLVHSDLHQYNVLWRADPGRWVAIDPKPLAGPAALALAPTLWNQWSRTGTADDLRTHLNLRLEVWCEAAGVEADLARQVTLLRLVQVAQWSITASPQGPELTTLVTIAKAMLPG